MRRKPGALLTALLIVVATALAVVGGLRGTLAGSSAIGDSNCDERVNSIDASLVLQYDAGLVEVLECQESADVNGDAAVDSIDATLILQFSAALLDTLGPGVFVFPVACELNVECFFVNYVDEDPRPGHIQDYACGTRTYDGHSGTDITLRDRDLMDLGVDVYAAASGTVIRVKDGHFDRVTEPIPPDAESNNVVVAHPNGLITYYGHLRNGSIAVAQFEEVTLGQKMAEVGSSGQSTEPHLHFEVLNRELNPIDPWAGPCGNTVSLWADQLPYERREVVIPPDAEEIGPLSCDELPGLRSLTGKELASLIFENRLSETILIDWINYGGELVRYDTLFPGESYKQGTFLTHPWVVSNEAGECLGVYLPIPGLGLVAKPIPASTPVPSPTPP